MKLTYKIAQREVEVLSYVAQGHANKQIARVMGIGESTVKTYMRQIFEKLDAVDRANAVAIGMRDGMITLPAGSEGVI